MFPLVYWWFFNKRSLYKLRATYYFSEKYRFVNVLHVTVSDKSEQDLEREQSLVDQWVSLTEERNAVLVPSAGSGIPGAPADWNPPAGMEPHVPVLFLDLNGKELSCSSENVSDIVDVIVSSVSESLTHAARDVSGL